MRTSSSLVVVLSICTLLATGCSREAPGTGDRSTDDGRVEPSTVAVPPQEPSAGDDASLILLTSGVPQPHLADASGKALYFVEGDTDGSRCTGACTRAWPPVLAMDAMPTGDANLQAGLIGVIERADGSRQVTYNRHPLYRYAADTAAGSTGGDGVQDQWGRWHALGATGEALPQTPR